jgi:hypothetical protein
MLLTFFLLLIARLCVIRPQCKWKVYAAGQGEDNSTTATRKTYHGDLHGVSRELSLSYLRVIQLHARFSNVRQNMDLRFDKFRTEPLGIMTVDVLVIHSLSYPALIAICRFRPICCTCYVPRQGSCTTMGLEDRIKLCNTLLSAASDIAFVLWFFWNCLMRIFPGVLSLVIEIWWNTDTYQSKAGWYIVQKREHHGNEFNDILNEPNLQRPHSQ